MSETTKQVPSLAETTTDQPGPQDPGYDAWLEAKLDRARQEAKDPSKLVPADQVWKEFGLEN